MEILNNNIGQPHVQQSQVQPQPQPQVQPQPQPQVQQTQQVVTQPTQMPSVAQTSVPTNVFEKKEVATVKPEEKRTDNNAKLVEQVFDQAITHKIQTDDSIQNKMLDAASTYIDTKMTIKKTEVDTEHKKAVFDNNVDACECYGFNEKTTPIWATKLMRYGYNVMLAIWWFIGCFTFMPIIFVSKKLSVGIKKAWIAVVLAIVIYLLVVFVPILVSLCTGQ